MRILIIEDEYNLADAISTRLKKEKYLVDIKTDGEDGYFDATTNAYDLIVLDVMLPGMNGFEILKKLREENITSKIIMLTAKSTIEDKLDGLENGANDYLTKPFHMDELVARINIQLKSTSSNKNTLGFQDLVLDLDKSKLTCTKTTDSIDLVRSDRGGGTVTVDGGTYKTTGKGSPSIYSTANITVSNATLTSTPSEGVVIEGKNSVTLENVSLTGTNNTLNGQSTTYKNIFLYQSMSGDAADGSATFIAKNSNITTNKGDTLYVTNTTASITLENNTIINNDKTGNFLRIQKDSWGNSGSNGGDVTLTLKNQSVSGNIVVDSISTLNMTLTSKSYYEGAINSDNSAKSITLKLDKNSKIKLTADTYVTTLDDEDTTYSNIDLNGYKLFVNNVEISK